jgi:hypothetical protein
MHTDFGTESSQKTSTWKTGEMGVTLNWILWRCIVRIGSEWNWLRIMSSSGFWYSQY